MSDFLSQFEDGVYKSKKNDAKKIMSNTEENDFEITTAIEAVNHETVLDSKYNKRKIILYMSACITIIIVTLIVMVRNKNCKSNYCYKFCGE